MRLLTLPFASPANFMAHYSEARSNGAVFYRSRMDLDVGEEVVMEISFGGLPNRILARGEVLTAEPTLGFWIGFHKDEAQSRDFLVALAKEEEVDSEAVERSYERFPANLPVDYSYGGITHRASLTEDLGAGGVFVRSQEPPPVGTNLQLVIGPTNEGAEFFTIDGEVAWVRPKGASGFGVRFDNRGLDTGRLRKLLRRASETGDLSLSPHG